MPNDRQLQWTAENRRYRARWEPIGTAADQVTHHLTHSRKDKLKAVQAAWAKGPGAEFLGLAFPSALRDGILEISVTTAAVIFAIEQERRAALLDALRSELGVHVRDIRCVVRALSKPVT